MTKKPFKTLLYLIATLLILSQSAYALNFVKLSPGYYPNSSKGKPLSSADIYVGKPDLDPEIVANQKTLSVQQEDGTIVAVSQPIHTNAGGVPQYAGSPVVLLVEGDYSLKVLDSSGSQIYYVPSTAYEQYLVAGNYYYPDYTEADQGDAGIGSGSTVTDILLKVGAATKATMYFSHNSGAADTTYTFTTNTTISDNYNIIIEDGVIFDGVGILTINGSFQAGLYQVFGDSITVNFGDGSVKELYPEWWGAKGDASTDCTAAIEAAITAALTDGPNSERIPVVFGIGEYRCAEVEHDGQTLLIGSEVGHTRLVYNGAGGADSYILGYNAGTGNLPWGGIKNMMLDGWTSGGEIAEHCWKNIGLAGIDLLAKFENLALRNCYGNAMEFGTHKIVNLHIDKIRFDHVGGFPFHWDFPAGMESRPITINQFTVDNAISGDFATKATSDGYYDGTYWGKGLAHIEGSGGAFFTFYGGRIEGDKQLIIEDTRPCFILTDTSGLIDIQLQNVHGFFNQSDAGVVVYAKTDYTNLSWYNADFYFHAAILENGTDGRTVIGSNYGWGVFIDDLGAVSGQNYSFRLLDRQIAFQSSMHDSHNKYMAGDIIFNTSPSIGGPVGWVITAPTGGVHGDYLNFTVSTDAVVTAASAVVTITTTTDMRRYAKNLGVTLVGAGIGSADLDTYVTDIDHANSTITVNDAATTAVDPLTIKIRKVTATEFGVIDLQGSDTWDPGDIANGAEEMKEVTVTGAVLGDFAIASFSIDLLDLVLDAQVTAADTVTCVLANNTGGAINLTSGTVRIKVIKK